MDRTATGKLIAQLRGEKGMTQKELAEKLRVTDKAVSRWETGRGLPDTALLKPLSQELGITVGELLAGQRMEPETLAKETDGIILDALRYSGSQLRTAAALLLALAGTGFLLSPLFLACYNGWWMIGPALLYGAVLVYWGERAAGRPGVVRLCAVLLLGSALLVQMLPVSAVLVFADGPNHRVRQLVSCFDLLLVGYGHFLPLLAALATVAGLALALLGLRLPACRNGAFVSTVLAVVLSLLPGLLMGQEFLSLGSHAVTALLLLSACFQAVSNRTPARPAPAVKKQTRPGPRAWLIFAGCALPYGFLGPWADARWRSMLGYVLLVLCVGALTAAARRLHRAGFALAGSAVSTLLSCGLSALVLAEESGYFKPLTAVQLTAAVSLAALAVQALVLRRRGGEQKRPGDGAA